MYIVQVPSTHYTYDMKSFFFSVYLHRSQTAAIQFQFNGSFHAIAFLLNKKKEKNPLFLHTIS